MGHSGSVLSSVFVRMGLGRKVTHADQVQMAEEASRVHCSVAADMFKGAGGQ